MHFFSAQKVQTKMLQIGFNKVLFCLSVNFLLHLAAAQEFQSADIGLGGMLIIPWKLVKHKIVFLFILRLQTQKVLWILWHCPAWSWTLYWWHRWCWCLCPRFPVSGKWDWRWTIMEIFQFYFFQEGTGSPNGNCAAGLGVCCLFLVSTCKDEITYNR